MKTQEDAKKWWDQLSENYQIKLVQFYYPEKEFILIAASFNKIEAMYRCIELDEGDE